MCQSFDYKQDTELTIRLQKHHKIKNGKIKSDQNRALLTGFQNLFQKYHKINVCVDKIIHMK